MKDGSAKIPRILNQELLVTYDPCSISKGEEENEESMEGEHLLCSPLGWEEFLHIPRDTGRHSDLRCGQEGGSSLRGLRWETAALLECLDHNRYPQWCWKPVRFRFYFPGNRFFWWETQIQTSSVLENPVFNNDKTSWSVLKEKDSLRGMSRLFATGSRQSPPDFKGESIYSWFEEIQTTVDGKLAGDIIHKAKHCDLNNVLLKG